VLRVVGAHATGVTDSAKTLSLGSIGTRWTNAAMELNLTGYWFVALPKQPGQPASLSN
jgi:hypothetical protein